MRSQHFNHWRTKMKKGIVLLTVLFFLSMHSKAQWTQQASGTTKNLWGVSFVTQNLGYVCGDSGTILKTINGGITWTSQNSGTSYQLAGLQFVDANTGYAMSWFDTGGIILKTVNGGTTWNKISLNIAGARCGGMYFFTVDTGLISYGDNSVSNSKILRTVNGGVSWDTVYSATAGSGSGYEWLSFMHFPTRNVGYATVSGSKILKTTDGGKNWTLSNNISGNLWMSGVYFFNKDTGFVGGGLFPKGGGSILKTTNGGTSWQPVTNTFGTSIMLFTSSSTGWAVGTDSTWNGTKKMLKTTDGGMTWARDTTPKISLNSVVFPNVSIGYSVGDKGTILRYGSTIGVLADISSNKLTSIYPNPANDIITLHARNEIQDELEIRIYTFTGTLVKIEQWKQNIGNIDVSEFVDGIYFVEVRSNDWNEMHKIILQR